MFLFVGFKKDKQVSETLNMGLDFNKCVHFTVVNIVFKS